MKIIVDITLQHVRRKCLNERKIILGLRQRYIIPLYGLALLGPLG